jgi:hypothetical protein
VSADASLDEEVGLHGDDARKPGLFPYEAATKKMARIKKKRRSRFRTRAPGCTWATTS